MLGTLFHIFSKIVLPIFILVAIGFTAQKKLKMDSRTFSRINIYILIPAVLFIKIYNTDITLKFFGLLLFYIIIMEILMLILGELVSKVFKYPLGKRKAFCNSLLFFNSGNYGLPLVDLAFQGNPVATTSQLLIMIVQNVTTNTFGVFQASSGNNLPYKQIFKNIIQMPSIYALACVLVVKIAGIKVPEQVLVPLQYISQGFIGLALITLGVQLAEIKARFKLGDMLASSFIRLALSPLLGFLFVMALGVKGILAQSMILGVSMPSAVNTAIIAKEFDNEPEFASQIVLVSTVLSPLTISAIIYLIRGIS